MSADSANLIISAGDDISIVLNSILDHHDWLSSSTVILALAHRALHEQAGAPGPLVAAALKRRGISARVTLPPVTTAGAWLRSRQTKWIAIELLAPAGRLERVWLPASIEEASALIAISDLQPKQSPRDPIAIGIWARFAHPRQRTGAWLSDARDGLTAEIASAVRPGLILVFAKWRGFPLIVASDDQIAAELAGLAMQQLTGNPFEEQAGPWEDPLVQHATELMLGVQSPALITAGAIWTGDPTVPAASAFHSFASTMLARIGVESSQSEHPRGLYLRHENRTS